MFIIQAEVLYIPTLLHGRNSGILNCEKLSDIISLVSFQSIYLHINFKLMTLVFGDTNFSWLLTSLTCHSLPVLLTVLLHVSCNVNIVLFLFFSEFIFHNLFLPSLRSELIMSHAYECTILIISMFNSFRRLTTTEYGQAQFLLILMGCKILIMLGKLFYICGDSKSHLP